MARTTVEDCLLNCPNHFELAIRASRRARELMAGGDRGGLVDVDDDKPIVHALREIAAAADAEEEEEAAGEPGEAPAEDGSAEESPAGGAGQAAEGEASGEDAG